MIYRKYNILEEVPDDYIEKRITTANSNLYTIAWNELRKENSSKLQR